MPEKGKNDRGKSAHQSHNGRRPTNNGGSRGDAPKARGGNGDHFAATDDQKGSPYKHCIKCTQAVLKSNYKAILKSVKKRSKNCTGTLRCAENIGSKFRSSRKSLCFDNYSSPLCCLVRDNYSLKKRLLEDLEAYEVDETTTPLSHPTPPPHLVRRQTFFPARKGKICPRAGNGSY